MKSCFVSRRGAVIPGIGTSRGKTTKIPVYYVAVAGLLILIVVFYFLTRHRDVPTTMQSLPSVESTVPASPAPLELLPQDALPLSTSATEPAIPPATGPLIPATPAAPVAALPVAAPTNGVIVVELEVQEESWFKLSADGTDLVPSEVLAAGTTRRYTAANSMAVSIGNAAGVSLRVNGQPVSSLGRSGQVRNLTITPTTSASSLNVR
jgi:hypothetical protein